MLLQGYRNAEIVYFLAPLHTVSETPGLESVSFAGGDAACSRRFPRVRRRRRAGREVVPPAGPAAGGALAGRNARGSGLRRVLAAPAAQRGRYAERFLRPAVLRGAEPAGRLRRAPPPELGANSVTAGAT